MLDEEGQEVMKTLVEDMLKQKMTQLELYRDLTLFEKKVRDNLHTYNYRQGHRYKAAVVTLVIMTPLMFLVTQGLSFAFFSTKDINVLQKEINTLIPQGTGVNDILDIDDFMLLSWDVNQRTPRFFSKWAKEHIKNDPKQDYDMTFDEMVTASGANIYYFHPF